MNTNSIYKLSIFFFLGIRRLLALPGLHHPINPAPKAAHNTTGNILRHPTIRSPLGGSPKVPASSHVSFQSPFGSQRPPPPAPGSLRASERLLEALPRLWNVLGGGVAQLGGPPCREEVPGEGSAVSAGVEHAA